MKKQVFIILCLTLFAVYCQAQLNVMFASPDEDTAGGEWKEVNLQRQITHAQPMTGIAVWPWKANDIHSSYGKCIQLEFNYFEPSEIVKGCKDDGTIIYDWSSFERTLRDVASRGHQLVARFFYEYPGSPDEEPAPTVVPQYIKQLPDYKETYSKNAGTYYADWSNAELQRFTIEFYTAFAERYAHDPRLAFLEVGFGHWSEYHIYPTTVIYGKNFPSKEYQKRFLLHMSKVCDGLPWLISKNAADNSSISSDKELLALRFGMFEDSFMGKYFAEGGYEKRWNSISKGTRWQTGVCGGEISLENNDQLNFLRPEGLYGFTFKETASKYHFSFAICNAVADSKYGTPARVKEASLTMGYRYVVKRCITDGVKTRLLVSNEGIAPIYRDAYFAIGDVRSETSLLGLLPDEEKWIEIAAAPSADGQNIRIVSDYILPQQEIQFEANLQSTDSITEIPANQKEGTSDDAIFNISGQQLHSPKSEINIIGGRKVIVRLF